MSRTKRDETSVLDDLLKKTTSTVAKGNMATAVSTPSAKEIMDPDNVTLATFEDLKKKIDEKEEMPCGLGQPRTLCYQGQEQEDKGGVRREGSGEGTGCFEGGGIL